MTHVLNHLRKPTYEAVVVGTGFGGAVAACRLAQAGIDVAVLERGRRYPPGSFPRRIAGRNGLLWERGEGLYDIRPLNDMLVAQQAAPRLVAQRAVPRGSVTSTPPLRETDG